MTDKPANPTEGGSYLRQPDGSLVRRTEEDAPAEKTISTDKARPAGKPAKKEG